MSHEIIVGNENQAPESGGKRPRNPFGHLLSKSRVISVLREMGVDAEQFRVLYTARTRGMTQERLAAVWDWNNDGDTEKLMRRLGIKNQGTAFRLIGQVNHYLRHKKEPSFNAYEGVETAKS